MQVTFFPRLLLPGIEYVITQLKSLILAMGLVEKHLTVEQAVLLSRLEEEYQVTAHLSRTPWPLSSPMGNEN